jgi:hypothetical protein
VPLVPGSGLHLYDTHGIQSVEEGQSSVCVRSSKRKYPFPYHKRKTIIFIIDKKRVMARRAHEKWQEIQGDIKEER